MAETAGYFNGISYDEEYPARRIRALIANGVYNGELQVTAKNGMTVNVAPGRAWCEGYFYENDEKGTLRVATAHGSLTRIDAVMLRLNREERTFAPVLVAGTPAAAPTAPEAVRSGRIFDLKLAEITVPGGASSITGAMIRDTRLFTAQCGLVHGVVEQIDTTTLMTQLEQWAAQYREHADQSFETWYQTFTSSLLEITSKLSEMVKATGAASTAAQNADAAARRADTAAGAADAIREDLITKRDGGYFQGEQGLRGVTGAQGPMGTVGAQGPTGPAGPTGPRGPAGIQGAKGEKGEQGERGESGVTAPLSSGLYSLFVNASGQLVLKTADGVAPPPLSIKNGQLVYTI